MTVGGRHTNVLRKFTRTSMTVYFFTLIYFECVGLLFRYPHNSSCKQTNYILCLEKNAKILAFSVILFNLFKIYSEVQIHSYIL